MGSIPLRRNVTKVSHGLVNEAVSSVYLERYQASLLNVFGTPAKVLVRGEGTRVWDADGNEYLDLLGGIAVNALGYNHPDLTAAICRQASQLCHVSNFFATPPQIELAEKLLDLAAAPTGSRVFFANSGTEAIEAALKLSRLTGRKRIVAFVGSFHGRSTGALAITSKEKYRSPFAPLLPEVVFVPYGDHDAFRAVMTREVAAVVVEPIQGEGGVVVPPATFLPLIREMCSAVGALMIVDEIQTGMGRTGTWLAYQHQHIGDGITPDVVTLAKSLGGGLPIGAVITYGEAVSNLIGPGQHGTTFGGNPLVTAAANTVIDVIQRDDLLPHVATAGQYAAKVCLAATPLVTQVRGAGLLLALQLAGDYAQDLTAAAYEAGFIVNPVKPDAIRLAPPYVISFAEIDAFASFLAGLQL